MEFNEEQVKKNVVDVMKEFLKTKKFVSKEDIFSMTQNNCNTSQLEQVLVKLTNDGIIVSAHDNNHYFFV